MQAEQPRTGEIPMQTNTISKTVVSPQTTWRDYLSLTKPRVISLLLVTTVAAMFIANRGVPPVWTVIFTIIGGYLAAGGANAINCFLDRDIDVLMERTQNRALPRRRMKPEQALHFGLVISLLSFFVLWWGVNLLSAVLAWTGIFYYVFIYTRWLKRKSVQNVVIGGAAGAIPPLVGWAAVTGSLSLEALWLYFVIYFWTPPHFWALAIVRRDDYSRAGLPMLPVLHGSRVTGQKIVHYSVFLFVLTLAPVLLVPSSWLYAISAVILGGLLIFYAVRLLRQHNREGTWQFYKYSMVYLGLLFMAMVLQRVFF
jgi:heme o synthase